MVGLTRGSLLVVIGIGTQACGRPLGPPAAFTEVTQAGWSFGFCAGSCRGELDLSGGNLTYRILSWAGDDVFLENGGYLSTRGRSQLASLVAEVPSGLLDRYGCPDCADGGAAFLTLEGLDGTLRIVYEYEHPPPELADLHAYLHSVMDVLRVCRGDATVAPTEGCEAPEAG